MPPDAAAPVIIVVAVVALVVVLGGGATGYVLLTRTQGSPQQTAASYLRDWQRAATRRWTRSA